MFTPTQSQIMDTIERYEDGEYIGWCQKCGCEQEAEYDALGDECEVCGISLVFGLEYWL